MSHTWHLETLVLSRGSANALASMMAAVIQMLGNAALAAGIEDILNRSRESFKARSNEGFVWHERRWQDFGNYRYAVLYQLLFRLAVFYKMDARDLFVRLGARYSSLEMKASITSASLELRGDVIEVILADCRETGPAVDKAIVDARVRFCRSMVQFHNALESILQMTYSSDDGPPCCRHFLDADLFVKICCGAHAYHCTSDGPTRDAILENFRQAVELALRLKMACSSLPTNRPLGLQEDAAPADM